MNPDATEFVPSQTQQRSAKKELAQRRAQNKGKNKQYALADVVLEHLAGPQRKFKAAPKPAEAKPNPMIKARIIVDNEKVSARIPKNQLYSGVYEVVPKKPSKVKEAIKRAREEYTTAANPRYLTHPLSELLDQQVADLLQLLQSFYLRKKAEKRGKVPKRFFKGLQECTKKARRQ